MVPLSQVRQVDLSCVIDIATDPDLHVLGGADEDYGCLEWVSVQQPNGYRDVVV